MTPSGRTVIPDRTASHVASVTPICLPSTSPSTTPSVTRSVRASPMPPPMLHAGVGEREHGDDQRTRPRDAARVPAAAAVPQRLRRSPRARPASPVAVRSEARFRCQGRPRRSASSNAPAARDEANRIDFDRGRDRQGEQHPGDGGVDAGLRRPRPRARSDQRVDTRAGARRAGWRSPARQAIRRRPRAHPIPRPRYKRAR